jgi:hypothetical protein
MKKTIRVSGSTTYPLSSQARETLETVLTSLGKTITDDSTTTNCTLTVSITREHILIRPHSPLEYTRFVDMTTHLSFTNASGIVLFASGLSDSRCDTLNARFLHFTDDGKKFCINAERHIPGKNHQSLVITSFMTIIGILVYFAFQ